MTDGLNPTDDDHAFLRFEFTNRERAIFSIEERDLEAQLLAIKGVLRRNREADKAVAQSINELDEYVRSHTGDDVEYQMQVEGKWLDALHDSVFRDAANSMSAVGMLGPFVESLFISIFLYLRKRHREDSVADSSDVRSAAAETAFWDPHFVFEKGGRRTDLVGGIKQLATSTGLAEFLPDGYEKTLTALFAYRNKMFHHGFEWPVEERQKFDKRIIADGWPSDWFSRSTSNGEPWAFYMSMAFIAHCLATIDAVLEGFGKFLTQGKEMDLE